MGTQTEPEIMTGPSHYMVVPRDAMRGTFWLGVGAGSIMTVWTAGLLWLARIVVRWVLV